MGTHRATLLLLLLLIAWTGWAVPRAHAAGRGAVLYVPTAAQIPAREPPPAGQVALVQDLSEEVVIEEPQKRRRVKATVIPTSNPAVPESTAVAVLRSSSEALRKNERLDLKDLDARLSDFAQEIPIEQVDLARSAFQKGREALDKRDFATALPALEESVDQLVLVLPYIKKQELADAMLTLAVAQLASGNKRACNAALIRLFTWRPEYDPEGGAGGADIREPLEAARRAVARSAKGEVRITSEPSGAQAFIDGVYVGVTPVDTGGLLVGEHYVTFKKLGFKKALRVAQVSSKSRTVVQAKLARSEKFLLVKQAMDRVEKRLGEPQLDPVVDNLKETLLLDHGVFLRLAPLPGAAPRAEDGLVPVMVTAYLYDLRSRKLLREQGTPVPSGADLDGRMGLLGNLLYSNVDYEGTPKATPEPPRPPPVVRTPLYKKWWFLTLVGVVAAGSAAAVGVGVTLGRPGSCPDGHLCSGPVTY